MKLASHELHALSELIAGCYNTISCMAGFINQAQDPELKGLLQRHFPFQNFLLQRREQKYSSIPTVKLLQLICLIRRVQPKIMVMLL